MAWGLREIQLTQQPSLIDWVEHRLDRPLKGSGKIAHRVTPALPSYAVFLKSFMALCSAIKDATGKVPARIKRMEVKKLLRALSE